MEYTLFLAKLGSFVRGRFPAPDGQLVRSKSSFHRAVLMRRLLSNSFFMQTSFSLQSEPLSSVRDYLRLTPLPPIVKEFVARYYSPLHKGHEGLSPSQLMALVVPYPARFI